MTTLSIVPTDPALIELIGALNAIGSGAGLTTTEHTLTVIANKVAYNWAQQIGDRKKIKIKKTGAFSREIFSDDKMVHWLEKGLMPFDMRLTHPFGKKSRRVKPRMVNGKSLSQWEQTRKDGTKYTVAAGDEYLIIPFRHGTTRGAQKGKKGLKDIYSEVQAQMGGDFKRSKTTKSAAKSGKQEPNAWDKMIDRAEYSWGSKVVVPDDGEFSNLQGMVVTGPPKHSQFMSFRVVSVNSQNGSWQHPGIKPRNYLENIIREGQINIQSAIEKALSKDLSS